MSLENILTDQEFFTYLNLKNQLIELQLKEEELDNLINKILTSKIKEFIQKIPWKVSQSKKIFPKNNKDELNLLNLIRALYPNIHSHDYIQLEIENKYFGVCIDDGNIHLDIDNIADPSEYTKTLKINIDYDELLLKPINNKINELETNIEKLQKELQEYKEKLLLIKSKKGNNHATNSTTP